MSGLKLRVILQGNAKYRDGKKWKKRYCLLALSPKNKNAVHLYVAKTYDDFAVYRNEGYVVDIHFPSFEKDCELSTSLVCQAFPSDIGSGCCRINTKPDSSASHQCVTQHLVNTAVQSCLAATEASLSGLSAASALATKLNAPMPLDELTGFESGYHMDRESNIIVLIGINSVYIFALQSTDEMFHWAEAMSRIMIDSRFHVTLSKSTGGSKLSQGTQGSLHVQQWRLCLIGEPSAGCKFICSWKLDSILKAYTLIQPPTAGAVSTVSDTQIGSSIRRSFLGESMHRSTFGSLSFACGVTSSQPTVQQNKPKHLFILETDHNSGKGRGTYTFELDGGSINDLSSVISQLMNRRFSHGTSRDTCETSSHDKQKNMTPTVCGDVFNFPTYLNTTQSYCPSELEREQQSLTSSITRSPIPTTQSPSKRQFTDFLASRSNPLPMPIHRPLISNTVPDHDVSTLPPNRSGCHYYSNLRSSIASTCPADTTLPLFDMSVEYTNNTVGSHHSLNNDCVHRLDQASTKTHSMSMYTSSSNVRNVVDMYSPNEETHVARVAAGLVISKWPGTTTRHHTASSALHPFRSVQNSNDSSSRWMTNSLSGMHSQSIGESNIHSTPCDPARPSRPYRCPKHGIRVTGSNNLSQENDDKPFCNAAYNHHTVPLGVFRADEDLSDTEPVAPRKSVDILRQQHPSKMTINPSYQHTCIGHHLVDKDVREVTNYQHYRQRYCHYRMCTCLSYTGRSLSADVLYRLYRTNDMDKSNTIHVLPTKDAAPKKVSGCLTMHTTSPCVSAIFDRSSHHTIASHFLKTFRGSRWKSVHRFFHRKHSKSHDNMQHHYCLCDTTSSIGKPTIISSSLAESSLDFAVHWKDVCVQGKDELMGLEHVSANGNSFPCPADISSIFVWCARHGFRAYDTWLHIVHAFPSFVIRPPGRHKKESISAGAATRSTTQHHIDPRTTTSVMTISGPSVLSTFRSLVHPRHKFRESVFSLAKVCVRRRISAPLREEVTDTSATPHHTLSSGFVHSMRDASSSTEPSNHPHIHVTKCDPTGNVPLSPARPPTCSTSHDRRCYSVSSLSLLTSSEPVLFSPYHALRHVPHSMGSFYSSFSSLPTSPSISDSSSLLSGSLGIATLFHKKDISKSCYETTYSESTDPVINLPSTSFYETDGLSSGSLSAYCDDVQSNELHSTNGPSVDVTKNLYVDCSPLKVSSAPLEPRIQSTSQECDFQIPCRVCQSRPVPRHSVWPSDTTRSFATSKTSFVNQLSIDEKADSADTSSSTSDRLTSCTCTNNYDRTYESWSFAQRSNTLPTSKIACRFSKRDTTGHQLSKQRISSTGIDPSVLRLVQKVRNNSQHNMTTHSGSSSVDCKHSYQFTGGAISSSSDSVPTFQQVAYQNLKPSQPSPVSSNLYELSETRTVYHKLTDENQSERSDTSQSAYVNLPRMHSVISNPKVVPVGYLESDTADKRLLKSLPTRTTHTTMTPYQMQTTSCSCSIVPNTNMCLCGPPIFSLPAHMTCTSGLPLTPNFSNMPAEVRDPMRNYAMVDLRPSPASSVNTKSELTLGIVHHQSHSKCGMEPLDLTASSGGSVVTHSNSTGSDAATLTSDTLGSYAAICTTTMETPAFVDIPLDDNASSCPPPPPTLEITRRRNSHSLSSTVSETPVLNYVHVVASAAPMSARREESGSSCAMREFHADSPSSSSGLGGVASQSTTPPTVPNRMTSLGDIFTSRSMTSSTTSSGGGNQIDPGFHSFTPPDDDYVAYTQIDFIRTLALGEVHGDMEQYDTSDTNKTHSHSQWYPFKTDRSVRQSLTRPIRSIRRQNTKKSSS